jgi:tetratricopeptide (TPR) repeat protein
MPLAVAGVATFYSKEFYELCRARLAPNGIVVQWVPLHATNLEVIRTLLSTFRGVFPECTAWFLNADLFVAGSESPLRVDFANAERRVNEPQIAEGLRQAGIADAADMLSCFFMSRDAIASFSKDAPTMTDDRPWVEFLVPRVLHRTTVGESLNALIPHFESPLAFADRAAMSDENRALRERLELRFRARSITLKGIVAVYQSGPAGNPEEFFEQALDIDPTETLARSYYSEIAPQRFEQFLRQREYEEAEAYLNRYEHYVPQSTDVWLFRGQLYTAWDKPERAAAAYDRLAELTKSTPRSNGNES